MSGNDFEKQVQQKMDELSFVPSDAVWPEVEKQIAERKKRRVLFLWLPFLLLLLGGAAWMYISGIEAGATAFNKDKTGADNATSLVNKNKEENPPVLLKDSMYNQRLAEDKIVVTNNIENKKRNIPVAVHAEDKNIATRRTDERTVVINRNETGKNNNPVIVKEIKPAGKHWHKEIVFKSNASKKTAHLRVRQTGVEEDAVAVTKNDVSEKESKDGIKATAMERACIIAETPVTDSVAKNSLVAIAKPVVSDSAKHTDQIDSAGAIAKSKKNGEKSKKKIEWGIDARSGLTNVSNGFSNGFSSVFSGGQSYYASDLSNNLNNSIPGNNNANGGNFSRPSDIKTGFSYAAGLFIRKPLGKGLRIAAGLNYSYYSNSINVGAKIDSNKAIAQYRTGSTAKYTNRFHFIELPVTIEKQLGSKSRFSLNSGIAFSLLTGSNALLYDRQKSIYTEGKSQINKMQVSLLAGARYRLFDKKFPVEIGPGFNYALGNLFAKELYGSRHLFFAGINARVFLSKK